MLTIYQRHQKGCKYRHEEGRKKRACQCVLWVDGILGGQEIRQSLKMRDWQRANALIHEWEARGCVVEPEPEQDELVTIERACIQFLDDARARELRPPTLEKYQLLFRRLQEFSAQHGLRYIKELDIERLRAFRASWPDHNLSALKKLERMKAFFGFCHDSGWLESNPARKIKNPKITDVPTLPFSPEEVSRILAACDVYPDKHNAPRVKALVLLLRHSGLRIRDAVTLNQDRIADGKLFLRQAKTNVAVWVPLPPFVVDALDRIPGQYPFWTGESNPKSCVGNWQRALRRLFKLAGVPTGHAHRYRDTFAVELLLAGVPLDRVSVLLGHQSIAVTQRSYSPWVRSRQEQLESDIRGTWAEIRGTPEVRGKHEASKLLM